MIGHQDVGVQDTVVLIEGVPQVVQVAPVILVGEKAWLAVVAALDDVLRNANRRKAGFSWHALPPCNYCLMVIVIEFAHTIQLVMLIY